MILTQSLLPLWAASCLLLCATVVSAGPGALFFESKDAMPPGNLKDLKFVSRVMVPYGPNLFGEPPYQTAEDRPWQGWGFGMQAAEELTYDPLNHYAYVASAVGFVTIVDYQDPTQPKLTDYAISWAEMEEINDLAICPDKGWLFVSISSRGVIGIYDTLQRGNLPQSNNLTLVMELSINGGVPSNLLPNSNCTLLAVSNENEEDNLAFGTVTLLRDLDNIYQRQEPTQTNIPMDFATDPAEAWDDEYVLRKGLHMPLTRNALEYWDEHSPIANDTNFTHVRQHYRSSLFLEGETLSWSSPDEDELLVNLQINNGMLRIDVQQNRALALAGYGLKDHGSIPVDIDSSDKACNLTTYPNLFALRNPDSIRTLKYNDKLYLLTANEGADKEFEQFEEETLAGDLFQGDQFGLPNVRIPPAKMHSADSLFNALCEESGKDGCLSEVELTVGSSAIDFERDPAHPTFERMVLIGGRGWTIYELPEDPDDLLKLVFDSGSDIETTVCQDFPWAYNAEVDEEYAPTNVTGANHTLWNYDEGVREDLLEKNNPNEKGCLDQGDNTSGACPLQANFDRASKKGGAQIEHIDAGVACGRLFAVTASEKSSTAWLYDITDITSPSIVKTFHLSPVSETKSPGLAYNDGTIGEIDPENFMFLSEDESPTGKPAMLFGGAFSGTLSYWEFECVEEPPKKTKTEQGTSSASSNALYLVVLATMVLSGALAWI